MTVDNLVIVIIGVFAVVTTGVLRFTRTGPSKTVEKVDKFRSGFYIEPAGHGRGQFYVEPDGRIIEFLYGPRRSLLVWSEVNWLRQAPDWARGRREEIMGRLSAQERHAGFMAYESEEERAFLHRMYRCPNKDNPVV